MRRLLLATAATAALIPAGAPAQSGEDARTVVTVLKNQLDLATSYLGDQFDVVRSGTIRAVPADGVLLVDYPELVFRMMIEDVYERLEIILPAYRFPAVVEGETIRLDYGGPYAMTVARQEGFDDMGGVTWETDTLTTIAMGDVSGSQILRVPDGWTTGADVEVSDILVTTDGAPEQVSLDGMSVVLTSAERADRRWDMQSTVTFESGWAETGGLGQGVRWSRADQTLDMNGYSIERGIEWNHLATDLTSRMEMVDGHEFAQALVDLWFGDDPLLEAFHVSAGLDGLALSDGRTATTVGAIDYGLGMSGMGGPEIDVALNIGVDGWSVSGTPPEVAEIAPQTVRLALAADAIPVRNLIADAEAALIDGTDPTPMMMGSLITSAAVLTVEEVFVESPLSTLSGGGTLRPDPTAMMGAVGAFDFRISGLPDTIAYVAGSGMADADETVAALTLLQSLGQETTDAETGAPYRHYRMELTAQGQVLLNGTDFLPLLRTL